MLTTIVQCILSNRGQQECWWDRLQRASDPTQTVLMRLSAAKALYLAGPGLVQQNVGTNLQNWQVTLNWYVLVRTEPSWKHVSVYPKCANHL